MKSFLLVVLFLLATDAQATPEKSSSPKALSITDRLRAGVKIDAQAKPGQQFIELGPMRDSRELTITTKMVNSSSAVSISPSGVNEFVIHMGRDLSTRSFFVIDATLICAHFPKQICGRMGSYLARIEASPSVTEIPFLEEAFPDLKTEADKTRADVEVYKASLLAGIQSVMLMATLHEIGHAAFHHLDRITSDGEEQIAQEGEADAFATYVAELANSMPAGLAAAFLLDTVQESVTGTKPVVHPPALCRATMMATKTIVWLQKNKSAISTPNGSKERDAFVSDVYRNLSSPNLTARLSPDEIKECKNYISAFSSGLKKAGALVDQHTRLASAIPGQN